ncbi:hypothetical protein GOB20_15980 [Sinorhizobium meliloti]|nr:hypothetical protein [Sinorhizobium meliloti]
MAVFETWSKRQKRLRGETNDVFEYDSIPRNLRVQIVHITDEVVGNQDQSEIYNDSGNIYASIVKTLRREYGVFTLAELGASKSTKPYIEATSFILNANSTDFFLDILELFLMYIDKRIRVSNYYIGRTNNQGVVDRAIEEINIRFKEAGVGYQYVEGQIIRVDSELLHQEAVKPALRLLNTKEYAGAHEEFINAYEHYKAGKNKEALNDCLKAFESTMKAICDKRQWTYKPTDTAKTLIDICLANELIPSFWQTQFTSLRSLLESSIPTGRNKLSGHGQGATPQTVPDHLTAYMLHMTASTLVFLTTAEKEIRTESP